MCSGSSGFRVYKWLTIPNCCPVIEKILKNLGRVTIEQIKEWQGMLAQNEKWGKSMEMWIMDYTSRALWRARLSVSLEAANPPWSCRNWAHPRLPLRSDTSSGVISWPRLLRIIQFTSAPWSISVCNQSKTSQFYSKPQRPPEMKWSSNQTEMTISLNKAILVTMNLIGYHPD